MSIGDGDIVYDNVRVRFDYDELVELVRDLGFEDEKTIEILVKAVAYYAADPTRTIEKAFTKIGEETGVSYKAVAMRLRRAIEKAEKNGELKYIDRYIPGACYDYDYGYTVKELVALIYYHLSDNDLIIVRKES